jgi:hypothetical protein
MRIPRYPPRLALALAAVLSPVFAQPAPEIQKILDRLDRLEAENRELREEIRKLREQTGAAPEPGKPSLEERAEIGERRTAELAQIKVEASQRFPIRITGMALFNAFHNSKLNGGSDNPAIASLNRGTAVGGATFRQSILGFDYRGPETIWGGKAGGSLYLDFFAGSSQPLNNLIRIRTASFDVDWKSSSVMFGQEKPIISPRDPDSIAQVGISPLTGAGNLWLWVPQARFEQRFRFGGRAGVNARIGVIQTSEAASGVPAPFAGTLERYRPGLEGRFEFFRNFEGERRFEIAPGFHTSTTHVAGGSAPSRVFSIDWLAAPVRWAQITGFFYNGRNIAHFGTGGIRQGFWISEAGAVSSVGSRGGWMQLKLIATPRLSFHLMAGQQDDRDADVRAGFGGSGIGKNQAYGANFIYKLAPNILTSFELMQVRTRYLSVGNRLNNHYDLGVAYLF